MATVPLSGDEGHYVNGAQAISRFLTFRGVSFDQMLRQIVGAGWFMPGMSLALVPVYAVDSGVGIPIIRLVMSVLTFLLWIWAIREVGSVFGRWLATALLIFPPLVGIWQLFSAAIWADLSAGLVLIVVLVRTYSIARHAFADWYFSPRDLVMLELVLALLIYLRGSMFLVAIAVHIFLFALLVISGKFNLLVRRSLMLAAGGLLLVVTILPWSFAATHVLGSTVFTTSTIPLSLGITFGDSKEICFGSCPGRNVWTSSVAFSRAYARQNGISQIEAQRKMAAHALTGLTVESYLRQVRSNLISFVFYPDSFAARFLSLSKLGLGKETIGWLIKFFKYTTQAIYFPFLFGLVAANFLMFTRSSGAQIASLCLKMFTLCIFVQPFVHPSHSRYWPSFAPLMAIATAFVVAYYFRNFSMRCEASATLPRMASRVLVVLQSFYIIGLTAFFTAVLLV